MIERNEGENEISIIMHYGGRPCHQETTLLFAGTISLLICPGSGPTERRRDRIRQKASDEKKGKGQRHRAPKTKTKKTQAFLCPAGGQ